MGSKIEEVYGKPYIYDYIGNVKYQIGPLSFFQVNPTQTKVLYEKSYGIRRFKRRRNRMGSLLRNRNYFLIPGSEMQRKFME